jgi:type II secretory pathway component PulF
MMTTRALDYSSESDVQPGDRAMCSVATMWMLVGLLAGVAVALVTLPTRRPQKRSVSELSGALTYPLIMMCVGTGIMVFLVAYVVPQVTTIFEQQHAALPASTKLVIKLSEFVTGHWLALGIPLAALVAGLAGVLLTPSGRRLYHYYDQKLAQSPRVVTALEPVMTLAMAAVIVFMMLAVLMPIFQLNQLMQ